MQKTGKNKIYKVAIIVLILLLTFFIFFYFIKTSNDSDSQSGNVPTDKSPVYDYNDLSTAIADLPAKKALDEMYILLSGYWISDEYPFVHFFINADGAHCVEYGLFQTGFGMSGEIIDASAVGPYKAELVVRFPARLATEMDDARPESTETIYLDVGGLYPSSDDASKDTSIVFKSDNLANGSYYTYVPGGNTLEQAYQNWEAQ